MHSLPRNQEEIINDYIREWKKFFGKQLEVKITDEEFTPEFELKAVELAITDKGLTMKELKQKEKRKEKRELQKIRKDWEDR